MGITVDELSEPHQAASRAGCHVAVIELFRDSEGVELRFVKMNSIECDDRANDRMEMSW